MSAASASMCNSALMQASTMPQGSAAASHMPVQAVVVRVQHLCSLHCQDLAAPSPH